MIEYVIPLPPAQEILWFLTTLRQVFDKPINQNVYKAMIYRLQ